MSEYSGTKGIATVKDKYFKYSNNNNVAQGIVENLCHKNAHKICEIIKTTVT